MKKFLSPSKLHSEMKRYQDQLIQQRREITTELNSHLNQFEKSMISEGYSPQGRQ